MKTLVVLSDSHGKTADVKKLQPLFAENDYIVHLGDGSTDMRPVVDEFPNKTYVMKGNCDFYYGLDEYVLEVEEVRILCCHGHRYGVKTTLDKLVYRAKELDCKVALYGHTHIARAEEIDGVLCINPGSLGSAWDKSYLYLVVNGEKVTNVIVPLNK